jgi:hypothetical protein
VEEVEWRAETNRPWRPTLTSFPGMRRTDLARLSYAATCATQALSLSSKHTDLLIMAPARGNPQFDTLASDIHPVFFRRVDPLGPVHSLRLKRPRLQTMQERNMLAMERRLGRRLRSRL